MHNKIKRIKELVSIMNQYRNAYYNKNISEISDYEYDRLYDELKSLEESTGIVFTHSPTQIVGCEVKSKLEKVIHSHPMLSLDKTKSTNDLKSFASDKNCILSLKLDGLTIMLTYENGQLVQAETRGNGELGEIVTHNAKVFDNIPLHINYKGHLEIEGEAIITYDNFEKINSSIENPDDKYKNPRNLVSGSVRQLDSSIATKRHIKFIAWKVPTIIEGFDANDSFLYRLLYVRNLGFDIVPLLTYVNGTYDEEHIEEMIEALKNIADELGYPIDGLVMTYNDIHYGESLGMTGHHPKHSIAFKFYDEEVETTLKDIEFTMGKTGVLTPTAIFDPVEISGSTIEKASIHNLSVMEELLGKTPHIGQKIIVYKANDVIPQVLESDKGYSGIKDLMIDIPTTCPVCGGKTEIKQDNDSRVLICTNPNCKGKLLGKLTHFVSKNAMNIDGLSEATLEKFIELGWINDFIDIYNLKEHKSEIMKLEGFGKKSVEKLLNAIEKSRNATLDRFIYSLCIPLIGKSASKTISKYFNGKFNSFFEIIMEEPFFDWTKLEDFGSAMEVSLCDYFDKWCEKINELANIMTFDAPQIISVIDNPFNNKTICVTGKLNNFTRDSINEKIASLGAKVASSVTKKTDYLLTNEASNSSKYKKAMELNIKVISEEEFLNMIN